MPLYETNLVLRPGLTSRDNLIAVGPSIAVKVEEYSSETIPLETSNTPEYLALIDTGATDCHIDDELAVFLGLPIVDTIFISGSSGKHNSNVYMARVILSQFNYQRFGRFAGVALSQGDQPHKVILGRSMLSDFIMIYDGVRGQVTLAK